MFEYNEYFQHNDLGPDSRFYLLEKSDGARIMLSDAETSRFSVGDIRRAVSSLGIYKIEAMDGYLLVDE